MNENEDQKSEKKELYHAIEKTNGVRSGALHDKVYTAL